jgi:hypothetical protein
MWGEKKTERERESKKEKKKTERENYKNTTPDITQVQ